MPGGSPPSYSAAVATLLVEPLEPPDPLPFSHSDRLAIEILALVSEEHTLDERFKRIHDVASTGAKFAYEETAFTLCQKFETLIWGSRSIAGVALVAVKDFNEIILDFLSEPNATVQDRLKELVNTSKLLQQERESAANQKSSFDALIKALEDFRLIMHSESDALIPKRRRQSHSGGRGTRDTRPLRKSRPPFVAPRSEPRNGISTVTVSLGAISRNCMDYALRIERNAEKKLFPWCVGSPPEAQGTSSAAPSPPERKRACPPVEHTETTALPGLVEALVRDLCAFSSRTDIFNAVFEELAREQDIFVLYLKDGQSVVNYGYRSEVSRLRRHLPSVCNALDAYSKGRSS